MAGAGRRAFPPMPLDARVIDGDGAGGCDQQHGKPRNRRGQLRVEKAETDRSCAEYANDRGCDVGIALPHAHLAGRIAADILKAERAHDEREREKAEEEGGAVRFHRAKIIDSSAKALNSSALPLGSSTKNVACSPGRPTNLMSGSMTNLVLFARNFSASARQSVISRITPKCRTGTCSPSTTLCALCPRPPPGLNGPRSGDRKSRSRSIRPPSGLHGSPGARNRTTALPARVAHCREGQMESRTAHGRHLKQAARIKGRACVSTSPAASSASSWSARLLRLEGEAVPITLRLNPRARRLIVKVHPSTGEVTVVAPSRHGLSHADGYFARSEREWIARRLAPCAAGKWRCNLGR